MKRSVPALLFLAVLAGCASPGEKTPTSVRLPDAPPEGEPAGTTGLSDVALRAAYGAPALVRRDGGAQIWRYDGAGCRAFFFLYSRDGKTAVWHVETSPRGRSIAADENCLSALRARSGPPRPSA
jgi:hypothetical protein